VKVALLLEKKDKIVDLLTSSSPENTADSPLE
jgi:hypothetical protein